ncbi:hypothetical protein NBRC116593_28720 [Sulfitobacter pacificus]
MKLRTVLMMPLLTVSAMCSNAGDFCDVWQGPKRFDPSTAAIMVQTDRSDVEGIKVENDYGAGHCA